MSWTIRPNVLVFIAALILRIDFVNTALEECSITETDDRYYSKRASNGYGELLKTYESKNKSECQQKCCELEQCNFMMFSTFFKDHERSSNTTCFLFYCAEISKCKTKPLTGNITGISTIGIKQENITSYDNGSDSSKSSIEQHKIYKPLMNSTVHSSESQSINTVRINTDKPKTNTLKFNTRNNTDAFGIQKSFKLLPKDTHSLVSSAYLSPYPVTSISNNSYPKLSMITHSQSDAHKSGFLKKFNNSLSILSYPLISIQNSNHSTLSTIIHSTNMHTLGNRPRSNNSLSHHVGWLSGSYSNFNDRAHTSRYQTPSLGKISHALSSMSVDALVNSLQSNPDSDVVISSTFIRAHYSTEALPLLLNAAASLDVPGSSNVTQLHSSSVLSNITASSVNFQRLNKSAPTVQTFGPEQESHTTATSLVISLILGIFFFGTVVFLIGRRWSEQCFRRGYSRVDYLLNDHD